MIELSQVADTIRSVSCVGVQFGALQAEDGKLTLTKSPDVSRDLPSESNTSLKSIKFHFGESRLIGIAYMQTTLLLLRATGKCGYTNRRPTRT